MSSKTNRYEAQPKREQLTWQELSHGVAGLLLFGSIALWLRLLITYVDLPPVRTFGEFVIAATTLLVVCVVAIGCATVPPILWSAVIPSSVASQALSWLYAKYGSSGYWFCVGGALALTGADLWLVSLFWKSQSIFQNTPYAAEVFTSQAQQTGTLYAFSFVTTFLFTAFTSWAISRMTPSQLVAALAESEHAATILRAQQLKELQFRVTYATGVALLKADLLERGTEAFAQASGQFAAIVADMQDHEARAFRGLAQIMEAQEIAGNLFDVVDRQHDPAREHYHRIKNAMLDAYKAHQEIRDYAATIADDHMSSPAQPAQQVIDVEPEPQGIAHLRGAIRGRMNVPSAAAKEKQEVQAYADQSLQRAAADRTAPQGAAADNVALTSGDIATLRALAQHFGRGFVSAALVHVHFPQIAERTASGWLSEWLSQGLVITGRMRGQYLINHDKLGG